MPEAVGEVADCLKAFGLAAASYAPLQAAWARLLAAYDPHTLFVAGTIGVHLAIFWSISLLSALLEFWRPAALEPPEPFEMIKMSLPPWPNISEPARTIVASDKTAERVGGSGVLRACSASSSRLSVGSSLAMRWPSSLSA